MKSHKFAVGELIDVAVSVTNNCSYRIAPHSAGARRKGVTEAQFANSGTG